HRLPVGRPRPRVGRRLGDRADHLHDQPDPDPGRADRGGLALRRLRLAVAAAVCALLRAGLAHGEATALVVDGDVRLRRADVVEARRVGQLLPAAGGTVARAAQPGETIAFQVVVIAGPAPIGATSLALSQLVGPEVMRLRTSVFREHYVNVYRRS